MRFLFQDDLIAVCIKPAGVCSQASATGEDMISILKKETGAGEIFPVHRLDTNASGLMVYAKTQQAAAELGRQITGGTFVKEYICAVHSAPEAPEGIFEDILFKDSKKNKSYVVQRERKGAKKAKLSYRVIKTVISEGKPVSVVRVRLFTGRTHQIRVQFASRGMPLLGDGKYGARDNQKQLSLYCCYLEFDHPATGERMIFEETSEI